MGEIQKKDAIKVTLPAEWSVNEKGLEAINLMNKSLRSVGKHGIISTIPIICRGAKCPYFETCPMASLGVNVEELIGQRCPVEVSKIINKFNEYVDHFNIDLESVDPVVIGLIKELIDYEIQIERADKIMAKQGDFLENVVVGVSSDGRPIVNREIAKPIDYKERAVKKRHEILQLLNSTPKDKAGQKLQITMDPSTYASNLIAKFKELKEAGVVDADYFEVVEDEKEDDGR